MSGFVLILVIAYLALWVPMMATRPIVDLGAHAPTAAPVGAAAGVATFVLSANTVNSWCDIGAVRWPCIAMGNAQLQCQNC